MDKDIIYEDIPEAKQINFHVSLKHDAFYKTNLKSLLIAIISMSIYIIAA